MQHTKRVAQIKCVIRKRKVFGIAYVNGLRRRQFVQVNLPSQIKKRLFSQINSARACTGTKPLNEIGARSEPHFQNLLAMITRELGKRMDERLIEVAEAFD